MAEIRYEDTPVQVYVDGVPQTLTAEYMAEQVVNQVGEENLVVGPQGPAGRDGADGADGVGVPAGGSTGQVLAKSSATDFDTGWSTPLALGTTSTTALRGDYSPPADAAAATASMRRLGTGASEAAPGANAVARVAHGATAGTARPSGYALVIWIGSVEPTNRATGDLWVRTA